MLRAAWGLGSIEQFVRAFHVEHELTRQRDDRLGCRPGVAITRAHPLERQSAGLGSGREPGYPPDSCQSLAEFLAARRSDLCRADSAKVTKRLSTLFPRKISCDRLSEPGLSAVLSSAAHIAFPRGARGCRNRRPGVAVVLDAVLVRVLQEDLDRLENPGRRGAVLTAVGPVGAHEAALEGSVGSAATTRDSPHPAPRSWSWRNRRTSGRRPLRFRLRRHQRHRRRCSMSRGWQRSPVRRGSERVGADIVVADDADSIPFFGWR